VHVFFRGLARWERRSTLRSVVHSSGPLGLYAGVGMTLIGSLPFEGIKFGAYDALNAHLPRDADGRVAPLWKLLTGAACAHASTTKCTRTAHTDAASNLCLLIC